MTTVNVSNLANTVVVTDNGDATVVQVVTAGPQGPAGQAAQGYVHTQSTPATTWTMPHNLGYKPIVELLNAGSQEVDADVVHLSQNVTVAYFTTSIAGSARLI